MERNPLATELVLVVGWLYMHSALADNADTANTSNNPLNLAPGLKVQDYYMPKLYDTNVHTNDTLLRGTLPAAPNGFTPAPQLLSATVPISTRPDPHGGYSSINAPLQATATGPMWSQPRSSHLSVTTCPKVGICARPAHGRSI